MSEKIRESQATASEDARPTQGLYDEVHTIRGQQPTVSMPEQSSNRVSIGPAIQQDFLTIDDRVWEEQQSKARVIDAVFNIREATGKNYLVGWGTNEALIDYSLASLSPAERKQANALYLEKNGLTIRAEINDEESCSQRARSLSLLEWPTSNTENATEFWDNWSAFGSGDRMIKALAAMTREEIQVLERAHEDSYGSYALFDHLSGDSDHVLERALPFLEKGKDQRDRFESRSLLCLLANNQRYDTLLAVAKHAPEADRRWLANHPRVVKMTTDDLGAIEAKKILEALRK